MGFKIIDEEKRIFQDYTYKNESELERIVVSNADYIFGNLGCYFDIKHKIGKSNQGAAIPDGYFLDLKFHDAPKLYFVEMELSNHNLYAHIGEQVLRFSISSETAKHRIKTLLLEEISKDETKKNRINSFLLKSKYTSPTALLDALLYDKNIEVIIIIDENTEVLHNVLSHIKISTTIIEIQTYFHEGKALHRFTEFQEDIAESTPINSDYDLWDTIVVPAQKDGFDKVFLGQNAWYSIRISSAMRDKIKYIAAYQSSPVSAITHVAEVDRIEKYRDTDKCIVYFKSKARKIDNIGLPNGSPAGLVPQSSRYTNFIRLANAKTIDQLWK